jgi:epoxyqueuosine reductase QueG
MMQNITSKKMKNFVIEQGGDLVGITTADCFETTSQRRGPKFVMPSASSVVIFAQRMLVGSIESPSEMIVTFQSIALYEDLYRIAYRVGRYLEQNGYRAAIVPPYSPVEMNLETKGFLGEVSLRHVAKAAGLGTLGKNNLLITKELGPRIRLCAVVTTVQLEPDKPTKEDFCSGCESCISSCPVDALSEPGKTRVEKCVRQVLPYGLNKLMRYLNNTKSRQDLIRTLKTPDFWNMYQNLQHGFQYGCHICINICPVGISNIIKGGLKM